MATQGFRHGDHARLLALLGAFDVEPFPFDRAAKAGSAWRLFRTIMRHRPPMVVMEGTGIGGGVALMLARLLGNVPYVVSSGDAVAPFLAKRMPLATPIFALYERLLCRLCAGFIGWTPYLAGRALTFGAPRAMTAAGWDESELSDADRAAARTRVRRELGIGDDEIVFGIVGSLDWTKRVGYCYGYELVRAALQTNRPNVRVVIVGDGSGRARLEELAGDQLGKSILFTGRVPRERVPKYLAAMDVGSLPQSVDGVGSFRYTIKLSEYVAASLPIVTGQIPLAYDLDDGWLWRLGGNAPWDERYIAALARLMDTISPDDVAARRSAVPRGTPLFSRDAQLKRVTAFLNELLQPCAR